MVSMSWPLPVDAAVALSLLLLLLEPDVTVAGGRATAVPLRAVKLSPGSAQAEAQALNAQYLRSLDADRLLFSFRTTAGLANGEEQGVLPYPGWEDPTCLLRGHFVGHYLSAVALMHASMGDPWMAQRGEHLVGELAKCQTALGTGYLSAFGTDHFDRLETRAAPVWAPYYTIHKIMAGLLDLYRHLGSKLALETAIHMASYFKGRIDSVVAARGEAYWQLLLDVEFGGMNEVMYEMYHITQDPAHLAMARYFYKRSFMDPLVQGIDSLQGIHANTHLPTILGVARGYEVEGNGTLYTIAHRFYEVLQDKYTYVTGGNNVNEYWLFPGELGRALETNFDEEGNPLDSNGYHTQESCTQYNNLKIVRQLFSWEPTPALADMFERQILNGIMGTQLPGQIGRMLYMTPLGTGVSRPRANFAQGFGLPDQSFWCCYGTGVESFSKLGDSIYFQNVDSLSFWVLQFVSSTVDWEQGGLSLEQAVSLGPGGDRWQQRVRLTVTAAHGEVWAGREIQPTIHMRVPQWAVQARSKLTLNGQPVTGLLEPSSFVAVTREWRVGDTLEAHYGMAGHLEYLQDKRPEFRNTAAILFGPLVLAGLTNQGTAELDADPALIDQWLQIKPSSKPDMRLTLIAQGLKHNFTLQPLNQVFNSTYTVYFNFTKPTRGKPTAIREEGNILYT